MDLVKCKRSSSSLVDADWMNLPKDVLEAILIKLIYVADYIRFGAVCKSWLSLATDQKQHRIANSNQQPPLLLLTDSGNCKLYSACEGKVYSFGFQFPSNRRFIGSSYGWLAFEEDDYYNLAFMLVNPFTGSRITNLPRIDLGWYGDVVKVILSCDPSSVCNGVDFVVAAIVASPFYVFVAFIRPYQQKSWTFADCGGADANNRDFVDEIIFYKGMLYAVKKSHQLIAIDYKCNVGHDDEDEYAPCINIVPSIRGSQRGLRPDVSHSHLVEASNGDLLLVRNNDNGDDNAHLQFQVYKLLNETNPPSWVEVHKLDCGDVIFLGTNNQSLCTSMSCFLNCGQNSIYLARGDWHQMGVFHLDGGMMTKLQGLECLGERAAPIAWIRPMLR